MRRLARATVYSWWGLQAAFRHEAAFRQEVFLIAVLAPLGLWLGDSGIERALLVGSLFLVLAIELLNSAVEALADRFGGEYHDLCKRAKDMGSAAVLVSLVALVATWVLVLFT